MATERTYLEELVFQVKEESDTKNSIDKLANVVLAMDTEHNKRYNNIDVKIDKMSVALLGNGKPEKSLVTHVGKLSQRQKWIFGGLLFIATTGGGWLIVEILNRL